MDGSKLLLMLDLLLDDDNRNEMLSQRSGRDDDCMAAAAALSVQEFHSKPMLYSEHWISEYCDTDFKSLFRLSRAQFEFIMESVVAVPLQSVNGIEPCKALEIILWYLATQV